MSSRTSISRGAQRAIRGRPNNGVIVGIGTTRNLALGGHTAGLDGQQSPNTPPSDGSGSFALNTRPELSMQPNLIPHSVSLTQSCDYIVVGDLKVNEKVKKSLETIASQLFTGWPANYGNLDPKSHEKYLSLFSEEYTWAPSDKSRMISEVHSQFASRYTAHMSNLRNHI
ncbi:unnamed protein product [Cuscuta epithymum]|uniref:Uncharacterized protein n=1 Tax=Cuscuta epithymum TaxID=186058 RepID=A0AAV0EUH5_9ASTE|nr:unnamed protein product [Cuscuta epithymum]